MARQITMISECYKNELKKKKNKPGHRISGIEAVNLAESKNFPGWFEVDTSHWQAGIYRFNIHSKPYIQAPKGTELRPIRDGQYSWPAEFFL